MGISTTDAIRIFLSQVRLRRGLPFDVKIPNKTTLKAMEDAEEGRNLTECKDAEAMFGKLGMQGCLKPCIQRRTDGALGSHRQHGNLRGKRHGKDNQR